MIPLVSSRRMADIDRTAQQTWGIPGLLLMEQAGIKAFAAFREIFPEKLQHARGLVFAAGRGNNGGDALVMAREAFVSGFRNVSVMMLPGRANEAASLHRDICRALGIREISLAELASELDQPDMVVFDGLTGTGLSSPLSGEPAEAAGVINNSGAFAAAIDIPSGLYDGYSIKEPAVKAHCTIAMGLIKQCCMMPPGRSLCGRIEIVQPGFPPQLLTPDTREGYLLDDQDIYLPKMSSDAYKNSRGHAAVCAGSAAYPGAARLASHGAMSTRTGLVSLFCDRDIYSLVASGLWDSVICREAELPRVDGGYTSLLCGPGWGRDPSRAETLRQLISTGLPGVIDADGLYALSRIESADLEGRIVLTPHPGEFRMLQENSGTLAEQLHSCSRRYRAWVVYKSHVVLIAGPEGTLYAVDGMNPALGCAGSGDVLSGVIAGLLAEGLTAQQAACTGVLLHQRAGRIAAQRWGWFSSHQLFEPLMQSIRECTGGPDESA